MSAEQSRPVFIRVRFEGDPCLFTLTSLIGKLVGRKLIMNDTLSSVRISIFHWNTFSLWLASIVVAKWHILQTKTLVTDHSGGSQVARPAICHPSDPGAVRASSEPCEDQTTGYSPLSPRILVVSHLVRKEHQVYTRWGIF